MRYHRNIKEGTTIRPLEILLYVLFAVMVYVMVSRNTMNRKYGAGLLSAVVITFTLHLILEEARWQLYPLYVALVVSGAHVYLKTIMGFSLSKGIRRALIIGATVFAFVSLASALAFPLYELPEPGGEHPVGTESFVLEDGERTEAYGDDPGGNRRFKVQAWYPAETTEGYERAPWIDDGKTVTRARARDIGLPFFTLDHTADTMSHSYTGAPISEASDEYPVIILSHGWRGFRNMHTDKAEELASQGYIVLGIDHSHGSVATVLEDETLYLDPDALPPRETTPNFWDHANELVSTYAGDVTATLDYLETLDEGDPVYHAFGEALDLSEIGLLGHSTGERADVSVALDDDRIQSVIGLDAWGEPLEETRIEEGLSMPSLFLRSGDWEVSYNNDNLYTLIENSGDTSALYQIDGTTHFDFAMVYMYSPLTGLIGFTGDVDSDDLTPMLKSMITDFFDDTLKGESGREIDPDTWEEVRRIEVE